MGRIIRLATGGLLVCALLLAGCKTLNMGGFPWGDYRGIRVTVTVPSDMQGGQQADWVVTWTGGWAYTDGTYPASPVDGPFTISMDMGGGTTENVPAGTVVTRPFTQAFTMVNPMVWDDATYTYNIRVTDPGGNYGSAWGSYTVGPTPNLPPVIESAVYTQATMTLVVTVSDPDDGETLMVNVVGNNGVTPDAASKDASATGPLSASFVFTTEDIFTGATGTADVVVSDANGGSATQTGIAITMPGFPLAPDTLYAIPLQTRVATGDPVTVIFATGVPANPFQFLNGVGLTIEADADKVANSFNVGAPGGAADAVDGYWTAMAPPTFLMPPDGFIVPANLISDPPLGARERWDFNLTPVAGSDVTTASGALFNFQFTFGAAGTKTFGFQQFDAVNRTYYSDSTSTEYYWGDISNAGVPTVTVH